MEQLVQLAVVFAVLGLLRALYRLLVRPSIADIPGPEPTSFLLGNLPELFQEESGEKDFEWQEQYGSIVRVKAPFGEDMLWISDPKALQYIYQTSGYNFPKQPERRILSRLVGDPGLTWAEGDVHKRQRKVMLPAFGSPESKALLPVFRHYAEQVTLKWKDLLTGNAEGSIKMNVHDFIAPATLEAIGEAAFDYKLGVLGDDASELGKAYSNLIATIFSAPSSAKIFLQNVAHYVPMWIQEYVYDHLPGKGLDKARENRVAAHKVAHQLLEEKRSALAIGKAARDVMSILVRENAQESGESRLSHEEIIAQMRTIMLAGQETTSNTLSWALLELATQPNIQRRLREEVHAMEHTIRERGDADFTVADFEAMPYLQAVLKEILRFYPAVPHTFRQSLRDDVLPLSKPVTTRSGKVITELPIRAGLRLILSVCAYNREKEVWGEDAQTFNPDRWLTSGGKRSSSVGVYSNLLTFAGGVRACIGWRFAIYELQAFLVELVSNFQFDLTEDVDRICKTTAIVMVPTLRGELAKGVQMPLRVSLAPREE
ncbi:cytochrome P450 [Dichomitus squalens]|uniref:Cytochrome P450 n=2 Tax=Dichomitus squalens TaxID=114155 RepID=A0A4Q9NAZ5_9APHY|nr:cytochrome P450 [Dichomitus squalens LYAD-421 SS1]EJF60674.1 cytochrome P450 [Dichomitus squalens LYAD-421 SS1]TBU37495.1 cytochrome P450 [Dichomitus squalens]TBU56314.1 cytochrome P450 [Dichomitus squalens]